jgi:hypothetical protein
MKCSLIIFLFIKNENLIEIFKYKNKIFKDIL